MGTLKSTESVRFDLVQPLIGSIRSFLSSMIVYLPPEVIEHVSCVTPSRASGRPDLLNALDIQFSKGSRLQSTV